MIVYYLIILIITVLLTIAYFFKWHKHLNQLITMFFVLTPIVNLSYFLLSISKNLEEAIVINKFIYIGGCYFTFISMLVVFGFCNINLKKWIRISLLIFTTVVYAASLSIGYLDIFYKSVSLSNYLDATILVKQYGFMHTIFYLMVILYLCLSLFAIIYSYFKKKQASRKNIYLLFLSILATIIIFFIGRFINSGIELVPIGYVVFLAVYLVIAYRLSLYDITDSAIDSIVEKGDTGFISFDFKKNYLGSNETSKKIIPELNSLTVDKKIYGSDEVILKIDFELNQFILDNNHNQFKFKKGDNYYLVNINYLFDGKKKRGYQLLITDDTKNEAYIKLLNDFNNELQTEVMAKTLHLNESHNKFILGLATMVEKRDNSTGGHIKRTSEGVRILVSHMQKDSLLDSEFAKNIIKAAPMHDIGKIAVDDAILRKPGKFLPEEFEIMKTHAKKGAEILEEIVDDSETEFKKIAINVANYHHERYDGSGYPLKLKGEEIPLEARIMAIADVYDALVSKRVYKEKFPYDVAYNIIMDGMGSQFDKKLEKYFIESKEELEAFYSSLE